MGAFELQDTPIMAERAAAADRPTPAERPVGPIGTDNRKIKDECVIAYKVYDSCRRQNCLTPRELGPSRAAHHCRLGDRDYEEGEILIPPHEATSVTMDKVRIVKIQVVDKQPCPFRTGFWDVDIKYVFNYRLTFREAGGRVSDQVEATNVFNMKATLFGSTGADLVVEINHIKLTRYIC